MTVAATAQQSVWSESTASIESVGSAVDAPVVDAAFIDMKYAESELENIENRREKVEAFHAWQLRTVSKQAAQQKALHGFLKRRLRRRTTRSPEWDRLEEEALKNARKAVTLGAAGAGKGEDAEECRMHGNEVVPWKVRLPLEAYLPRRVRPRGSTDTSSDEVVKLAEGVWGAGEWTVLPTVSASAEWNCRKSVADRRGRAEEEGVGREGGRREGDGREGDDED